MIPVTAELVSRVSAIERQLRRNQQTLQLSAASGITVQALNVGSATGASTGQIRSSADALIGGLLRVGSFGSTKPYLDVSDDGSGGYLEWLGTNTATEVLRLQSSLAGDATNYTALRIDPTNGVSVVPTGTGSGRLFTSNGYVEAITSDAGTTNVSTGFIYRHRTSGTPAANFGTSFFCLADTNGSDDRTLFYVPSYWTDATDASRKSRTDFYAYDSAGARLAYSIGANGSSVLMGFFGTAPIAKPTGVAVTAAGIHAALVSLGLIAA